MCEPLTGDDLMRAANNRRLETKFGIIKLGGDERW